MTESFNKLIQSFENGIKKKEKGNFTKDDVKEIYKAAVQFFDVSRDLDPKQIEQIRDKWVQLAAGKLDKGGAMKKLQGTSRPDAIQSVLMSVVD